jgi:glutaminase
MSTIINEYNLLLEDSLAYAGGFLGCGNVSGYIPQLAAASPALLGVSLISPDGARHNAGDHAEFFTIQSISKVVGLIYALMVAGADKVFDKVGMEPSGDPFNCFIKLETAGEKPFNPFINAGAITVISLLAEKVAFDDILAFTCEIFGGEVAVDDAAFRAEVAVGKRNRSMAYLMSSKGVLGEDVDKYLDYYYRLCAIAANAGHLAHMGAVLARGGACPATGREIIPPDIAAIAKAIMLTCGLYDGSGEFAVTVGLPAKSGIGGGIVACGAGYGIGTFGPALDAKGNSVGGIRILRHLSEKLGLSMFVQGVG